MPKKRDHTNRRVLSERSAAAAATLPEVLQFMRLLWEVVHLLEKRSKQMASELGVTGPQRLVLRIVGLVPGASAGTLADVLHVHPSTLTGVLQRLVGQGLLRRSAESSDRRRAVLSLTTRGQRVNATAAGTVESMIAASLAEIGTRDAAATERTLSVIAEHLSATPSETARSRATVRRRRSRG
jgi:MarR family transcriptional regulator, organic hydroperoxide resistance regulator